MGVLGQWLDLMISEVFSNLWFYDEENKAAWRKQVINRSCSLLSRANSGDQLKIFWRRRRRRGWVMLVSALILACCVAPAVGRGRGGEELRCSSSGSNLLQAGACAMTPSLQSCAFWREKKLSVSLASIYMLSVLSDYLLPLPWSCWSDQ